MSNTTTVTVKCGSAQTGYGGNAIQDLNCNHLSNTGLGLTFWVILGAALLALGLLARYLFRNRPGHATK